MIENTPTNVSSAFGLLMEEVEAEIILMADSSRGVWEITDKGRAALKDAK